MKYNPAKYWWYRTTNTIGTRLFQFALSIILFTLIDYAVIETSTLEISFIFGLHTAVYVVLIFSTIRTFLSVILCLLATYDKRPYSGWVRYYNKEVRGR